MYVYMADTNNQKQVKFSEEEINEINQISAGFDKATVAFGKLYLQKMEMEEMEKTLRSEFDLLVKEEKEFYNRIVEKYGEGSYDPKTQIFTPKK